jgi:hypothetical protein
MGYSTIKSRDRELTALQSFRSTSYRMPAQALYEAAGAFCRSAASEKAPSRPHERSPTIHSSLYLPAPVYEALRKIAFDERAKIHGLVMQGIDAVLRKRGYSSVDDLKSGKK